MQPPVEPVCYSNPNEHDIYLPSCKLGGWLGISVEKAAYLRDPKSTSEPTRQSGLRRLCRTRNVWVFPTLPHLLPRHRCLLSISISSQQSRSLDDQKRSAGSGWL